MTLADILNLTYPSGVVSGQSFDIEWDIENIGSGSGYMWTTLYDTTNHTGIYYDNSYYYTGQTYPHTKSYTLFSSNMFRLEAGHWSNNPVKPARIKDEEEEFEIVIW